MPDGVGTAADLRARLAELNPILSEMLRAKTVRIAVNRELVADEAGTPVSADDEIALLPPLSGG
jgi:molybdopterin converting factor small subunit